MNSVKACPAALLFAALVLCQILPGEPRAAAESVVPTRPRVGLALSSGGALGLAHIGVLKVIEEAGLPVDVVAGTSMGSIIGALYAIGYSPREIERITLGLDWSEIFSDRLERSELPMKNRKRDDRYLFSLPVVAGRPRLPAGLISGQKIYNLFARLSWPVLEVEDFTTLPRPFACVATDLGTGKAVVLDHGYLPDALRASMSIPSIFTPVHLDGRVLVDGGIIRKLPAEDAKNLGADIVIGVDVSGELLPADKLNNIVDILNQTIDITLDPDHQRQKHLCRILIMPQVGRFDTRDYAKARELIAAGEAAARAQFEELVALADSVRALAGAPPAEADSAASASDSTGASMNAPGCGVQTLLGQGPVTCAPVEVDELEVRGLHDVSSRLALAELGIKPPALVTVDELEKAVDRLYSSGFFLDLRYRFEETPRGRKLVVIANENSGILLNTGLRYDSQWGISLLLNTSLRNVIGHGSQIELDLLLGERKRAATEYALQTGIRRSIGIRADVDYIDDHIDVYELDKRVSRWGVQSTRGGLFLETLLSRVFYAAAGLNMEWFHASPDIGPVTLHEDDGRLAFASGELWFTTLDRSWFPRRGTLLKGRTEVAGSSLGGDATFRRVMLTWQLSVPVRRRVTVTGNVFIGLIQGGGAPLHYEFFVGGINSYVVFQGERTYSFYGYRPQELSGPNAFAAGLNVQIETKPGWYIILTGNAGNAAPNRDDLLDESTIRSGGAATLGVGTPVGPLELSLIYSHRNHAGAFVSAGFVF
jgi:NTE family protein